MYMEVKKFSGTAIVPTKGTPYSAGFDLYCDEDAIIAQTTTKINTNIGLSIPHGYYGQVCARSGAALRGIIVSGGVIDSDYRGPIHVICSAIDTPKFIKKGDRISQIVIIPIPEIKTIVVDNFSNIVGEHLGFGSTGLV